MDLDQPDRLDPYKFSPISCGPDVLIKLLQIFWVTLGL
jgi:hypothetical protein